MRLKFLTEKIHASNLASRLLIGVGSVGYNENILLQLPLILILSYLLGCLNNLDEGDAYQYAIHDGHLEIHDNDLVAGAALLEGASLDQLYCLFAIGSLIAVDSILAHEYLLENIPVHVNVVHDQDLRTFTNR